MDIFQEVNEVITYERINSAMGWQGKKFGNKIWIRSPLNSNDKNPSLCEYIGGGWKDYSTGQGGGDVISLYAAAEGLKNYEAAKQLAEIFHITHENSKPVRKKEAIIKHSDFIKQIDEWVRVTHIWLCDCFHWVNDVLSYYGPDEADDGFWLLVKTKDDLDRWTDILIDNQLTEILKLYSELRKRGLNLYDCKIRS